MPATVYDPENLTFGAGVLYYAPLGSTEPTDLVSAWAAGWVPMGYTEGGSSHTVEQKVDQVRVAEEDDVVRNVVSDRTITIEFDLAELTATNMKRALNGGTVTVNGAVTTFAPPLPGSYVAAMLGWQSTDGKERVCYRRVKQTKAVGIPRQKAPKIQVIPMAWVCELTARGVAPYIHLADSTARG